MTSGAPVRLRRLDVQGFKSFASRTSFEFGPGITAIVGPNGSGKSNLADALRWVLGEQNPRALRLRRLEDVIFAGGGKRAQAGFAEVSITLDNADAWLPIEFAEVLVTRRLHRSGESEYLINRKRVRLRDLLDLFLKARLGQNSYAILGQGMVDTVLSLRPEERRLLIEEAADVRRHRLKIEEAIDQLAATRENRDRVELLLAEIWPRLNQLEQQAHRASEHAKISRDLADAIRSLHHLRLRSARERTEQARKHFSVAAEGVAEAAACLQSAEGRLAGVQTDAADADRVLREAEAEWRRSADEMREAEHALKEWSGRLQILVRRREETEAELSILRSEAAELEAEAPSQDRAAASVEEVERAIGVQEAASLDVSQRLERTRADLALKQQRHAEAVHALQEAQARLGRLDSELDRLEREGSGLQERRRVALERLKIWAADYRRERAAAPELERRAQTLRTAVADATRRARSIATALAEAEGVSTALAAELAGERRRLEMLGHEREARRPTEDVIVALLDALRGAGPGRPRVLGIVGGLLHVQMGFEIAIEAALADALSGLVVRTEREALTAISILRQIEAGRLTFFPLEGQRAAHPLNLGDEAGVLGVASRFVRCEEVYRGLFESLLGRMVIVEDLESARRVVQRGLGAAVTVDGTVLRPGGTVSGGAAKSDGYVFQAGREIEELQAVVAELVSAVETQAERVASLRAQAQEALRREAALTENLAELRHRSEALESSLAARRRRFESLRGELEWTRGALAEQETRRKAAADESAEARAHLAQETGSEGAGLEAAVRQSQNSVEALLEEQRQAAASLAELRGQRAALARERVALEALHESRHSARERTARLIAAREQSLVTLDTSRAAAEAEEARSADALSQLRLETKRFLQELEAARRRLPELVEQRRVVLESVAAARTSVAAVERQRLDAELAAARAAEEFERLQEEAALEGLLPDLDAGPAADASGSGIPTSVEELTAVIRSLRARIRALGAVNEEAEADYRESKERHDFLAAQVADLRQAETGLTEALDQLRQIVREQFRKTFQAINADFQQYFRAFFGGGQARLVLTEPEDYGESGVDIIAQPPGKRLQNLALLSGGERSMTAVALLFALLESNPAPFCVLDEVDAALDEANVGRFSDALAKLAERGQFLVVTHNRGTVQAADSIYGISMTREGVSNVLSMRIGEAAPLLA